MIEANMRRLLAGVVVALAFFFLALPRHAAAQSGNADEGKALFEKNCVSCHGPDGSGNTTVGKAVGARDLRSPEAKKLTDAEVHAQIDKGKGNMPPFGGTLTKAQIDSLIPFVRELQKKAAAGKKAS